MKKFNKSKVIIPALAMIALTTAASATGTVAWFTANSTVTATGMSFTAVASTNLFIGVSTTEKPITTIHDLISDKVTLSTESTTIKPCTLVNENGTVTVKNATGYEANKAPTYDNPGTANAWEEIGTITKAESNDANSKKLDDYIAHAHVKIARKQNQDGYFALTPTVTLSFAKNSPLNKALRAAWIIGTNYENLAGDGMTDAEYGEGEVTFNGTKVEHLADNTLIDVALMVWFEGSDADCTTSSAIHLENVSVEWSFKSDNSTQA